MGTAPKRNARDLNLARNDFARNLSSVFHHNQRANATAMTPSSKRCSERLEFSCMLAPWLPPFPVRSDPPLLEVFAIGAAVLVGVTLVHGSVLGRIVRDYHRGAK